MSYQVRITETAKQDLREIAFYIAEHSMDNETAKRFVMELREQCKRLVDFPQSGAMQSACSPAAAESPYTFRH